VEDLRFDRGQYAVPSRSSRLEPLEWESGTKLTNAWQKLTGLVGRLS